MNGLTGERQLLALGPRMFTFAGYDMLGCKCPKAKCSAGSAALAQNPVLILEAGRRIASWHHLHCWRPALLLAGW